MRRRRLPRCIQPTCCAPRPPNAWLGGICSPSRPCLRIEFHGSGGFGPRRRRLGWPRRERLRCARPEANGVAATPLKPVNTDGRHGDHDMAKIDETRAFIPVRIAVLTVSDTRGSADDRSGDTLAQLIRAAGHELADRAIVKDEVAGIRARVQSWIADPHIDVVIATGGTGFTGRDVTPEAVKPLFEKEIDGFATVFHMISFQKVATSTIQ